MIPKRKSRAPIIIIIIIIIIARPFVFSIPFHHLLLLGGARNSSPKRLPSDLNGGLHLPPPRLTLAVIAVRA